MAPGATSGHLPASYPDIQLWSFCSWTKASGAHGSVRAAAMLAAAHSGAASVSTHFLTAQLGPDKTLTFSTLWTPQVASVAAPSAGWTPGCVTGRLLLIQCGSPLCLCPDHILFLFAACDLNQKTPAKGAVLCLPPLSVLVHGSYTVHSV